VRLPGPRTDPGLTSRSAMLYFKMYLAEAEVPSSAFAAPDRFPFIYSRANDRDAVFVAAGEHSDELLPGFEEGVEGMKARRRGAARPVPTTLTLSAGAGQAKAGAASGRRVWSRRVRVPQRDAETHRAAQRHAAVLRGAGARGTAAAPRARARGAVMRRPARMQLQLQLWSHCT